MVVSFILLVFVPSEACAREDMLPVLTCTWAMLQVIAKNVRMGPADVGGASPGDDAGGFGTDSAISRGRCSPTDMHSMM